MDEKKAIEKATAEGFLKLFNGHFRTDFAIVELGDAPDVRCRDSRSNELNLEITLTEDRARDIQAALGRSNHKSIEALMLHNEKNSSREGKAPVQCPTRECSRSRRGKDRGKAFEELRFECCLDCPRFIGRRLGVGFSHR